MASASKSKVYFFFQERSFTLKNRTVLKESVESIFKKEGKKLNRINYVFCSDVDLLKLNKKYLSHDFYTDILTFNLSDTKKEIIAEVYISVERVKENAKKERTSFKFELTRVIFHGALHLCGYRDKSSKEIPQMRKKEEYYLSLYQKGYVSG